MSRSYCEFLEQEQGMIAEPPNMSPPAADSRAPDKQPRAQSAAWHVGPSVGSEYAVRHAIPLSSDESIPLIPARAAILRRHPTTSPLMTEGRPLFARGSSKLIHLDDETPMRLSKS